MSIYPPPLEKLIEQLTRLPGIGQKSATRVALYILKSQRELVESLAKSLMEVKERIEFCSICFNLTDEDPCVVCQDENRANGVICIVEGPGDQLAIEEAGIFKGRYHVLHGILSPLDGIGPDDLKIKSLLERIERAKVREVILATNPNVEGEATAIYLAKLLKPLGVSVTRIAMGLPVGSDLEYADEVTMHKALEGRREI